MSAILSDLDRKRLANARARAALQGIELHDIEGDSGGRLLVANKVAWALTRIFEGPEALGQLEAWLARIEGRGPAARAAASEATT
jgi:hypothetical protein